MRGSTGVVIIACFLILTRSMRVWTPYERVSTNRKIGRLAIEVVGPKFFEFSKVTFSNCQVTKIHRAAPSQNLVGEREVQLSHVRGYPYANTMGLGRGNRTKVFSGLVMPISGCLLDQTSKPAFSRLGGHGIGPFRIGSMAGTR